MPHLGQLCMSIVPVADLALRVPQAYAVCFRFIAVDYYPGLIFPQTLFADAGGTHPPPNLGFSLKEKR